MEAAEVNTLSGVVDKLCNNMEKRDKVLLNSARTIMKNAEEGTPRHLRKALKTAHFMSEKTTEIALRAQQMVEKVQDEIKSTSEVVGKDSLNEKILELLQQQEKAGKGALDSSNSAKSGIVAAEQFIKEGIKQGLEATTSSRAVLDMANEVNISLTVNSVRRLLLRSKNALESELIEGAHSKVTTGQKLIIQADREIGRLERDLKLSEIGLKKQKELFDNALSELSICSELHHNQAIEWAHVGADAYLKIMDELLSWRRKEEEIILAIEVETKTKAARAHAKKVSKLNSGLQEIKANIKQKFKDIKIQEDIINESRLELLGPCNCGLIHTCKECEKIFNIKYNSNHSEIKQTSIKFNKMIQRKNKKSDWKFNGPSGPVQKLGPGVYDTSKANKVIFPSMKERTSDLSKTYVPMPFAAPSASVTTQWARSLRPPKIVNDNDSAIQLSSQLHHHTCSSPSSHVSSSSSVISNTPSHTSSLTNSVYGGGGGGKVVDKGMNSSSITIGGNGKKNNLNKKNSSDEKEHAKQSNERSSTSKSLKKMKDAETAVRIFKKHLKQGGESIVSVKAFKVLLRDGGIQNPEVTPWLHGAPSKGSYGTNFEADNYHKPQFICLGSHSHLVDSPHFSLAPI